MGRGGEGRRGEGKRWKTGGEGCRRTITVGGFVGNSALGKNEPSQTNRSARGVCVEIMPRVQSKHSRAVHAHRRKKLLQSLRIMERSTIKRVMVRFSGAREKGAVIFVECLAVSKEGLMEGSLWRGTLGRSSGLHDTAEPVRGMRHGNCCWQETTHLHAIS